MASEYDFNLFLDQTGKFIGPVRVWRKYEQVPGLMMSRSFGDRYGHSCGVISTPEVINFNLDSTCKAIVLGSDGLWEVLTQQQIADIVGKHAGNRNAEAAAMELLESSTIHWRQKVNFQKFLSCFEVTFELQNV